MLPFSEALVFQALVILLLTAAMTKFGLGGGNNSKHPHPVYMNHGCSHFWVLLGGYKGLIRPGMMFLSGDM